MMKKVANTLTRRPFSGDAGKVVKYTPCSRQDLHQPVDEDLDEIAVVSNADPGAVRYGSGCITANGPRVIPGIITTERGRLLADRLTASGTRINMTSPVYLGKSNENVKGKSVSKQSLLEMVTTRLNVGGSGGNGGGGASGAGGIGLRGTGGSGGGSNAYRKRFSKDSVAYVNRAHVSSDLDVSNRAKGLRGAVSGAGSIAGSGPLTLNMTESRKRELKARLEKWETSTSGSERSGCKWTFVFDPSGRLCYYWSLVVSIAFLYNFWFLIYRFAFQEIVSTTITAWFSLDYIADFLYVLDVAFHFRTGYLEDGVLQTDSVKLRQHYMNSTTFYVDCLCLLPLDILYLSIGYNSMLRSFRLVKIYRFWAFLDRTERHTNYPNVFRAVSLIHYLMVIFHWNACLCRLISRSDGFGSRSWAYPDSKTDDVMHEYLHAFYWSALTLTTIGDLPRPRTKSEYLFVTVEMIFGLLLFATVLGHVANIVTNVSAARKEFQAKLDGVKTYMRMRRVSQHLQVKVIKWFDYLWMSQKSSDEERTVSCLPDKLKAEIAIHVHLDTLKRVEIFQNTEAGFLCELVLRLRPVLFSPGDYICRKGEVGKEMYIVNRGRLQVVADNGKTVLATLRAGSYFGEISILNMGTAGNRRTASVRSVGYSDLFCLAKQDMWDVLKEYPAARVRLEAIAAKRLEKYKKAPLEKNKSVGLGRCQSAPGLVESSGRVPLEEMYVPPRLQTSPSEYSSDRRNMESPLTAASTTSNASEDGTSYAALPPPGTAGFHAITSILTATPQPRSVTTGSVQSYTADSPAERLQQQQHRNININSAALDAHFPQHYLPPTATATTTTTAAVATKTLTTLSGHPLPPTLIHPPTIDYFNPQQQQQQLTISAGHHIQPILGGPAVLSTLAPPPYHLTAASSTTSILSAATTAALSLGPSALIQQQQQQHHQQTLRLQQQQQQQQMGGLTPIESDSQELLAEIKRLRERLVVLETENASMSMKLSQQQWEVEHRLAEIEMHICGGSSVGSLGSVDENERNRESII
ncbi:hypothetical protein CHUAL_002892 [Chamberlinius hualienensis]